MYIIYSQDIFKIFFARDCYEKILKILLIENLKVYC